MQGPCAISLLCHIHLPWQQSFWEQLMSFVSKSTQDRREAVDRKGRFYRCQNTHLQGWLDSCGSPRQNQMKINSLLAIYLIDITHLARPDPVFTLRYQKISEAIFLEFKRISLDFTGRISSCFQCFKYT